MINVVIWGHDAPAIENLQNFDPVISYSLIEGSGGSGSWDTGLGIDGGGNIDDDPLFAGGGDLRLTAGSPAIDAGDNAAPNLPAEDLDGKIRVIGGTVDMGAYEHGTDPTGVGEDGGEDETPAVNALRSVYPNPFNPTVTIEFDLATPQRVRVAVYDVKGRLVRVLGDGLREAGTHRINWDATSNGSEPLASGVYFLSIESAGWSEHRKMVLLK
jgi:hypothetical protein